MISVLICPQRGGADDSLTPTGVEDDLTPSASLETTVSPEPTLFEPIETPELPLLDLDPVPTIEPEPATPIITPSPSPTVAPTPILPAPESQDCVIRDINFSINDIANYPASIEREPGNFIMKWSVTTSTPGAFVQCQIDGRNLSDRWIWSEIPGLAGVQRVTIPDTVSSTNCGIFLVHCTCGHVLNPLNTSGRSKAYYVQFPNRAYAGQEVYPYACPNIQP